MNDIILKSAGLFAAIVLVSQLALTEKAGSAVQASDDPDQASLETAHHGHGCACSSCVQPVDGSSQACRS